MPYNLTRTEESIMFTFILFTFTLLLIALIYDLYVLIGTTIVLLAIILFIVFARLCNVRLGKQQDERSALCSLQATKRGFITAIVLMALFIVAAQIMPVPFTIVDILSVIWGASVAVYLLSYTYSRKIDEDSEEGTA